MNPRRILGGSGTKKVVSNMETLETKQKILPCVDLFVCLLVAQHMMFG